MLLLRGDYMSLLGDKKYKVSYRGGKQFYRNARDAYRAGERVEVWFDLIATDTDYTFFADNTVINPRYESGKGYIISFVMPPSIHIFFPGIKPAFSEQKNKNIMGNFNGFP